MDSERWRRIEELCQAALERDESEQAAFVRAACGSDGAMLHEVLSLLAHQGRAADFIEAPALEMAARALAEEADASPAGAPPDLIGRVISRYRVVAKLGAGGMGEVYRAVRADDQYRKEVALKLVRADLGRDFVVERFAGERQILASLEHPNIARLIDGGTTEDGIPHFVMELVEGQPIDEFCDSRRLAISERLGLFRRVCSAVHYAHQRLVVHRDLKPSNILVSSDGEPKLLDFGIAKVLDAGPSPRAGAPTVTGLRMMTPEYASPEQLRGEVITTASDVYSLGVLLYYLLTGHLPYRLTTRSPHEVARAICELEPERASAAVGRVEEAVGSRPRLTPEVVSSTREGRPDKLRRRLAGDLDQILSKAIRKEPDRRYASVEQLSEDIARHLDGRPILAAKGTLAYRSAKFIRRHRAAVVAAGLVLVSLTGGLAATLRQSRIAQAERARAERRFNDVRALANSLMFDINDSIANLPGATPARKLLMTKALQYLDSLAAEGSGDPALARELATGYQRIGDLQGLLYSSQNLGNSSEALESYRKALRIRRAVAATEPSSVEAKRDLALAYRRLGEVSSLRNDFAAVEENDSKALALYQAVAAAAPDDPKAGRDLAVAYYTAGRHSSLRANFVGAVQNDEKALSILEPLCRARPKDSQLSLNLAAVHREACYDFDKTGDVKRALDSCRKAVAITEGIAEGNPNDVRVRLDLSVGYGDLGAILEEQGDVEGSLECRRKALATSQAAAEADPKDARAQVALALAYNRLGFLMAKAGKIADVDYERRALEIRKKLLEADPLNGGRKEAVAMSFATLGDTEVLLASRQRSAPAERKAHWREARSWYAQAAETFGPLRAQGALRGENLGEPDRIAKAIADCDTALGARRAAAAPGGLPSRQEGPRPP